MKPVLFITGHVPVVRHDALAHLHEREGIELALFGGPHAHGAPGAGPPPGVPHRHVSQRELGKLASGGVYRALIAGTGGRVALPASWRAAQRSSTPFIFWAALWHQPRTLAHLAAYPLMRSIYHHADAVVTYGNHVSTFVKQHGARNVFIAPQAVDNDFWGTPASTPALDSPFRVLFVGRAERAKGLPVLLAAWEASGLAEEGAELTIAGDGHESAATGVRLLGSCDPEKLRNLFADADVLVIPSIPTRSFLEPWGLVANEAMNQATTIIATKAVGAAAGGLVRDGRNGVVVEPGDARAIARALRSLAGDRERCRTLGLQGREDVRAYTASAWADGFVAALRSIGCSRTVAG